MSTLENLRKSAKRWLHALRAGEPDAQARFARAYPKGPAEPTLRDVQHALARERGYENWTSLKSASAGPVRTVSVPTGGRTPEERVATFLGFACWDHHVRGRAEHRTRTTAALRLLEQHPDLARHDLYTAIVCGDLARVQQVLEEQPQLPNARGGPRDWQPLLYLAYARLPLPSAVENAPAIARALLERGADPNVSFPAGGVPYTVLVGVAGEGEQDAPPHPQREALYRLLLDQGAGPYDPQVLYNTHFHGDVLWWLELTFERAVQVGLERDWQDPEWPMFDMGVYGSGARFILEVALACHPWGSGHAARPNLAVAEWALSRGANPNSPAGRDPRLSKLSLYAEALRQGRVDFARLLAQYGAERKEPELDDRDRFLAACMRLDRGGAAASLRDHPEYLGSPDALFAAVRRDRADVVALLLDLGMPLEIEDGHGQRALHAAAGDHALNAAALLVDRGAEVDPRDGRYSATPLGYAVHFWDEAMIDLLAPCSRDVWNLAFAGKAERLREVLGDDPALAREIRTNGITPLWWLPDDEEKAQEIVDLLVSHGADPMARNERGETAADWALRRGMAEVARKLGSR